MLKADWPSSPEVGSSRNRRSWGLEASSTPMVTLLRASTPEMIRSSATLVYKGKRTTHRGQIQGIQ